MKIPWVVVSNPGFSEARFDQLTSPSCHTGHFSNPGIGVLRGPVMLAEPISEIAEAVHVVETICENTRERGGHGTDEVKDRIALLELEARIPA